MDILFYAKENGVQPAKEFIENCNPKMKAKILKTLKLLQENGNALGEPYSKHLRGGIFELRVNLGNNVSRILYFFFCNGKIILTNGFVKKTQRTPNKEIKLADTYRKDYIERSKEYD